MISFLLLFVTNSKHVEIESNNNNNTHISLYEYVVPPLYIT